MSTILFYSPTAVVANQAVNFLRSVHTPDYYNVPNIVINPDLSSVESLPMKYWKVPDGTNVTEMIQAEKDTVDASFLPGKKANRKTTLTNELGIFLTNRGYDIETRSNLQAMYSDGIRGKPKKGKYIQPMINWLHSADTELSTKHALVDAQTTEAGVIAVTLDTPTLIATDPNVTLSGAVTTTDSTSLDSFMDSNAEVTDVTGVKGPYYLMEILSHRRDLYNDTENPVYIPGHGSILGASGILQDHANRVSNIENIHQKLGWHEQQIFQSLYSSPKNLLIYYGWLNSFNSATNQWDNEKVAQDMAKYNIIILGDGIADPAHGDFANTQIIIPRIKTLNPDCRIFGYVAVAQSPSNFVEKVDQWDADALQVHGIFMDEAGYDFGKTRSEFNICVDYIHTLTNANLCFANAWNTDHILGTANDVSYPNSTYNSTNSESHLTINDWVLLESFPINTSFYTSTGGYESASDWLVRGQKAINLRAAYGVNFCASGIINNDNSNGLNLFTFGYYSAVQWALEGFGTSDSDYAASSAAVTFWARPNTLGLDNAYTLYPGIHSGLDSTGVYHRFTDNAHLTLNFDSHTSNLGTYQTIGTGSGQTGLQGVTGIQGVTGFYGQTGIQGTTGINGATGIQGLTGLALGATGLQGPTGLNTSETVIYKTATETRSLDSATLATDNTLVFSVASNSKYSFNFVVFYNTGATPDFKWDLNLLNGTLTYCSYSSIQNPHGGVTTSQSGVQTALNTAIAITTTAAGNGSVLIHGSIEIGANAGTLQFRWAQNTSNATSTAVLRGSYVRYKLI